MRNFLEGLLIGLTLLVLTTVLGFIALKCVSRPHATTPGTPLIAHQRPYLGTDSSLTHKEVPQGLSSDATEVTPKVEQQDPSVVPTVVEQGGLGETLELLGILAKAQHRATQGKTVEDSIEALEQLGTDLNNSNLPLPR